MICHTSPFSRGRQRKVLEANSKDLKKDREVDHAIAGGLAFTTDTQAAQTVNLLTQQDQHRHVILCNLTAKAVLETYAFIKTQQIGPGSDGQGGSSVGSSLGPTTSSRNGGRVSVGSHRVTGDDSRRNSTAGSSSSTAGCNGPKAGVFVHKYKLEHFLMHMGPAGSS